MLRSKIHYQTADRSGIRICRRSSALFLLGTLLVATPYAAQPARQLEALDRSVVAVKVPTGVFVSWRLSGTETSNTSFHVYRNGTRITSAPLTGATNLMDAQGTASATYTIKAVVNGTEEATGASSKTWGQFWSSIPLTPPPGGERPVWKRDGPTEKYTYMPSQAVPGDVDGDGRWDLVVLWSPTNARDNSQGGFTGNVYMDAYTMAGKRLWRADFGINIRAGAHYNTIVVADYNGDGKAEIMAKTGAGTKDGTGKFLSLGPAATDNDAADHRHYEGFVMAGPEYMTVFNGETGKEMATEYYWPRRHPDTENPTAAQLSAIWGDGHSGRSDRFLSTAAWLDGVKPSAVFQRGYYTRMTFAAWDWDGQKLSKKWTFDTNDPANAAAFSSGNHNLSVADVDADGKDEIIQGAMAVNDDGTLMYSTGLGHGDAMHLSDLCPTRPGLEVFEIHESKSAKYSSEIHDAKTGELLWGFTNPIDVGRGIAADIDARYPGHEFWSTGFSGIYACTGNKWGSAVTKVSDVQASRNFRIYWDGDLQDELLDGTKLDKWNGTATNRLVSFYKYPHDANPVQAVAGTKATPLFSGDLLGDWREEVVLPTVKGDSLLIFTTTTPTTHRLYTLMHDPVYRAATSWQNTGYDQPPHLGFWLGAGVAKAPVPNIVPIKYQPILTTNIPLPSLTGPTQPTAPANVRFVATPSTRGGAVKKVEFRVNGKLVHTELTAPYTLKLTNQPAGNLLIVATVYYASGATAVSKELPVTVQTNFGLQLNPNPWRGLATLTYTMPATFKGGTVKFSAVGLTTAKFFSQNAVAGVNSVRVLQSKQLPAGAYKITMTVPGYAPVTLSATKL